MRLSFGTTQIRTYFREAGRINAYSHSASVQSVLVDKAPTLSASLFVTFTKALESGEPYVVLEFTVASSDTEPCFLLRPDLGLLGLGVGERVYGIEMPSGDIRFKVNAGSPFSSFIDLLDDRNIFVVYELGVLCLGPTGDQLWDWQADDLISSVRIDGQQFKVAMFDGSVETLDRSTGLPGAEPTAG